MGTRLKAVHPMDSMAARTSSRSASRPFCTSTDGFFPKAQAAGWMRHALSSSPSSKSGGISQAMRMAQGSPQASSIIRSVDASLTAMMAWQGRSSTFCVLLAFHRSYSCHVLTSCTPCGLSSSGRW